MVRIFVPDVPEFEALIRLAATMNGCRVERHPGGYYRLESTGHLEFRRKELGVKPAIWYGLFTGGVDGLIEQFDRDVVRIVPLASTS